MNQPSLARRSHWRRRLLALAAGLLIVAVLLAVSGGFRVTAGGLRLSARSPLPVTIAALTVLAAWYVLARRSNGVSMDLDDAWRLIERRWSLITLSIAIASGLVAALYATFAAAGADASGYLSEARLLAEGRLSYLDTLASLVGGWQTGLTSPLGWRPGAVEGWQSPTYPPGLPLLMMIPHWAGGTVAAALVVAVSAAIAVWSTGLVAGLLSGAAGIVAAVSLATLPVFVYQSVQPMSDVPVTAAWMLCWLAFGPTNPEPDPRAGVACAIAVLIRPNLAPLAIVPLVFVSTRIRHAVAFATPVAVAGLALMWVQWHWYGSPLRSGYGPLGELFARRTSVRTLQFYARRADLDRADHAAGADRRLARAPRSPGLGAGRVRGARRRGVSHLRLLRSLVVPSASCCRPSRSDRYWSASRSREWSRACR